jgi:RNA polymerase-binding protein DksA
MTRLTSHQIEDLSARLARRVFELKEEIRAELMQSDLQHYRDLAGQVSDAADESVASMLVDIDAAIIDRHVRELRDIEAARQRINDGSYGLCAECGATVAYQRLAVYPTAKRCRNCQEQREKIYEHQDTPSL